MTESLNRQLRERVTGAGKPLLVPGAPNALTARILEETGFESIYISGAGVANSYLGAPDIGLLTLSEMADHVHVIRDAVQLPLVVDADTGFGNAISVQRTVRTLERAGANAIQLEDQTFPKRCGHFDGKDIIAPEEMIGKIRAALDARSDDALMIIARTDAAAVDGIAAACDRAARYLDAGADAVFVEAPQSVDEMEQIIRKVPGLHVANMVEGGRTPVLPLDQLADLGYAIVLYANTALRAAMHAMQHVAAELLTNGDSLSSYGYIAEWTERQRLVRHPEFERLEGLYGGAT